MRLFASLVLVGALLTGCKNDPEETGDPVDTDPDTDCEDTLWYADADADGYGDDEATELACTRPDGFVDVGGDCDDADDGAFPGGMEVCDGADNDCDGETDPDDAAGAATWYADGDADGYGVDNLTKTACDQPDGYAPDAGDCDDADPTMNPGEIDDCNGRDDDCDGTPDSDVPDWFEDRDGDGWGDTAVVLVECTQPEGYVAEGGDCDEGRTDVNPGGTEVCDGAADEDCDGTVDEDDAADALTWYGDVDDDGYGDAADTHVSCEPPSGYVGNDDDCDDGDASLNPETRWYADTDKDGYGNPSAVVQSCTQPSGYVADSSDCNDADAATNPDTVWYADGDKDGYGLKSSTTKSCLQPSGYVASSTDCDDARALTNPGATEYCNTYDDDCDGTTDEDDAADASTWYVDADSDSYGSSSKSKKACSKPSGYAATSTDCDDGRAATYPGASEYCNTYDDDCDGSTDEDDAVDAPTWYADADSDGYGGTTSSKKSCKSPTGYVSTNTDCDDADEYVFPGAVELCDMARNDCDDKSWTTDDEEWTVSWVDDSGAWSDVSSDVLDYPTYTLPDGTLYVCHGEYLVSLFATTAGNKTDVVAPYGKDLTIVNAAAVDTVLYVSAGTIRVEGLTLTNGIGDYKASTAKRYGGGVSIESGSTSPSVTLTDVDIDDNVADVGGGIYADGGTLVLDSVTLSDNVSAGSGGALYADDADVTIAASTFSGNTAGDDGGALSVRTTSATGALDVSDTTFDLNTATDLGGGLYVLAGKTLDVVLDTVEMTGNSAASGGGMYLSAGAVVSLDMDSCTVDGNEATGGDGGGLYLRGDSVYSNTMSIAGTTVSSNTSTGSGGGLYGSRAELTVSSTTIDDNDATTAGGGMYLDRGSFAGTSVTVDSNNVSGSSTTTIYKGGGVYASSLTKLSFTSSTVQSNTFTSTSTSTTGPQGGGLWIDTSATTFTSSSVKSNWAARGGGIYFDTTSTSIGMSFTNSLVSNNDGYAGAGLYQGGGPVTCTGSSSLSAGFTSNAATGNGGGIFIYTSGTSATGTFKSTSCDFGTTLIGNNTDSVGGSDVYLWTNRYTYNNDVTFTCTASAHTCS